MTEFGLYELDEYAYSYSIVPALKAEKAEVIASLYDDCVPVTVQRNDIGQLVPMGFNVEDMALFIIEKKEGYDKLIKRFEDKAKLFEEAMAELTPRELQVIQVYYLNRKNDLGLTKRYFLELLHSAQAKLCNSICELREEQQEQEKEAEKEVLKQRIQAWKQAN